VTFVIFIDYFYFLKKRSNVASIEIKLTLAIKCNYCVPFRTKYNENLNAI